MRVPLGWLKEYVDFNDTPQGLARKLTFSGIEVEGIETIGGTFDGVVVGKVLRREKHPNADKLSLCTVHYGDGEITVVCGAPNVREGGHYPFARVGVTLPCGITLKKAKIRGVESEGMLCAADELGLSQDHSGLLELDVKWAPGTPLAVVRGPPETVLDLEITPNRPDCLSLIGVAREVAALYGTTLKMPMVAVTESDEPVDSLAKVCVEDNVGCPRYTARVLRQIRLAPSPDWMARRLEAAGVRPINNIVDVTNYVMLECGQPLHAFDRARLAEGRIIVRRAREGDGLSTLDGVERVLDAQTLLICDAERPVALAGVMGGAGSEIQDNTTEVLLESAGFQASGIRATSRRLGLSTESSHRFERGVDLGGVEWASRRAAQLMQQLSGACVAQGVMDVYPAPTPNRAIVCRYARVNEVIGLNESGAEMRKVFVSLGLDVREMDAQSCRVTVPSFRQDLETEIDLVEEFARMYGLDKIPVRAPTARLVAGADDGDFDALKTCRDALVGLGLREVMHYSFLSGGLLDLFDTRDKDVRVRLPNPLSAEHALLRNSLVPQMVETMGYNLARQIHDGAFFELGRVFRVEAGAHHEENRLCVGLMGTAGRTGFDRLAPVTEEDLFLRLKGVWESLTAGLRIRGTTLAEGESAWTDLGRAVELRVDNQPMGVMGLVRKSIRKEWRLNDPVGVLEVRIDSLLAKAFAPMRCRPIPAFPSTARDVALVAAESVRHEDILGTIYAAAPKELESVTLFDLFRGEAIGPGRKSMAYSLTYRSAERTLTDDEANRMHATVKDALKKVLNVEIREG